MLPPPTQSIGPSCARRYAQSGPGAIRSLMPSHPTADTLERYWQQALSAAQLLRLDDHLAACPACRQRLQQANPLPTALASLRADLQAEAGAESVHVSDEQLAGFVAGALDAAGLEIVQDHLQRCARCAVAVQALRAP